MRTKKQWKEAKTIWISTKFLHHAIIALKKKGEMWNKNNVKAINTAEKNINNIVFYSFYFISFVFTVLIFVSLSSLSDQSGREATVENVVKLW